MVADALVGPHHVFADTVRTDAACPAALVDVFARLPVGGEFVAGRTHAVERARRVDARTTPAQTSVLRALVHIAAVLHVHERLETVVAFAEKRTGRVLAPAVEAYSVGNAALVDVRAVDAILVDGKAFAAVAVEATDGILAAAILAQSGKQEAFVCFCV